MFPELYKFDTIFHVPMERVCCVPIRYGRKLLCAPSCDRNSYQPLIEEIAMTFEDRTIACNDCGKDFVFSAEEQEFFSEKGFQNEPKRCVECRHSRKRERRKRTAAPKDREFFTVTCDQCGRDAKVPFNPSPDKPVYCSDCFREKRPTREGFDDSQPAADSAPTPPPVMEEEGGEEAAL